MVFPLNTGLPHRVTYATKFAIFHIKGIHRSFGQYGCIRRSLNSVRADNHSPAVPTIHRAGIVQLTRLRIPLRETKQTIGSFPHGACYSTVLVSRVPVSNYQTCKGPALLFIVTTFLCQDRVIYAPAAFLGCGSHLSGSLSGIEP